MYQQSYSTDSRLFDPRYMLLGEEPRADPSASRGKRGKSHCSAQKKPWTGNDPRWVWTEQLTYIPLTYGGTWLRQYCFHKKTSALWQQQCRSPVNMKPWSPSNLRRHLKMKWREFASVWSKSTIPYINSSWILLHSLTLTWKGGVENIPRTIGSLWHWRPSYKMHKWLK